MLLEQYYSNYMLLPSIGRYDCSGQTFSRVEGCAHPAIFPLFLFGLADWVAILIHEALGPHHLERLMKRVKRRVWLSHRAEITVGPGKVLPIIDSEVYVVKGVVRGAVDELLGPVT